MAEQAFWGLGNEKLPVPTHFDAVTVCGMGPLALKETKGKDNLVARNVMNFLNAIAAKILVSRGVADLAIMSGWKSQKGPVDREPSALEKREMDTSEAQLLAKTYDRARLQGIAKGTLDKVNRLQVLDEKAKTTFGNIIEAVNLLDRQHGGYWKGTLGVISSEFHGPRLVEMIKMFGVNARFLSAERIFKHFGYKGRLHPTNDSGYGNTWPEFEESVYKGQPGNYQNLLENPAYVTKELALARSDRRFFEMAASLKRYVAEHGGPMPDVLAGIPASFDPSLDYDRLRQDCAAVTIEKVPYKGESEETLGYRELARYIAEETDVMLEGATKP